MNGGWIGVDFDGTLASYDGWQGATHCGEPIAAMVERVKTWRTAGHEVRIFTARIYPCVRVINPAENLDQLYGYGLSYLPPADHDRWEQAIGAARSIREWSLRHLGELLPLTCVKDFGMVELYDDRCVQVKANTGQLVGASTRGL